MGGSTSVGNKERSLRGAASAAMWVVALCAIAGVHEQEVQARPLVVADNRPTIYVLLVAWSGVDNFCHNASNWRTARSLGAEIC